MAGILLPQRWTSQPQQPPQINWGNPITSGLVGLMWLGYGRPVDLMQPHVVLTASNSSPSTWQNGFAQTVTTAGANGVSAARLALPIWRQAGPLSCLAFMNHTSNASSKSLYGYGPGTTSGYQIFETGGARNRLARIYIGGVAKDATGGTWTDKECVKGLTFDGATVFGYDDGRQFGSAAAAGTPSYDATFARLSFLGNSDSTSSAGRGYWMGCWNRALTPSEVYALNQNPWMLFTPAQHHYPLFVSAGGTTDAAFVAADGTSTTSTLTGTGINAAAFTAADGTSTTGTLVGVAASAAAMVAADGVSTTSTLAGASVAASAFTAADGTSTAGTLTGVAVAVAAFVGASGSSTTSTLTGQMLGTIQAAFVAAAGTSTTSTLVPFTVKVKGLRKTQYLPQRFTGQLAELPQFVQSEFERLNNGLEAPFTHQILEQLNVEPSRKLASKAIIVYADGVNWNPGSGEGIYAYYGGSWKKLG